MPVICNEEYYDIEIVVGGVYEFIKHCAPDWDDGPQYEAGDRVTVRGMRLPEGWNPNHWLVDIGDCEIHAMSLRYPIKTANEVREAVRDWIEAQRAAGLLTDELIKSLEHLLSETE